MTIGMSPEEFADRLSDFEAHPFVAQVPATRDPAHPLMPKAI